MRPRRDGELTGFDVGENLLVGDTRQPRITRVRSAHPLIF